MQTNLLGMTCVLGVALPAAAEDRPRPIDGARSVVAAIVLEAEANDRLPRPGAPGASAPFRASGDQLTEKYIQAAARAALKLPKEQASPAFLLALGLALDDSPLLRIYPSTLAVARQVESEDERKRRLKVLNAPTIRGRRDLCQHFAVSATLTELLDPAQAESAGLAKEQHDMLIGTGFSFADLSADFAGVWFAQMLKKGDVNLAAIEKSFRVADFVPDHKGLREGLYTAQFMKEFGSVEDKRFRDEVEGIRKRIKSMPGYRRD